MVSKHSSVLVKSATGNQLFKHCTTSIGNTVMQEAMQNVHVVKNSDRFRHYVCDSKTC